MVADVDGTLTDRSMRLSVRAVEAVRRLEEEGVMVMLASHNALCVVKALATYMGCSGPIICEGGGVVEHGGRLVILGSRERASRAMEALRRRYGDAIVESWSNRYRLVDQAFTTSLAREVLEEALSEVEGVKLVYTGFAYHVVDSAVDKGRGLRAAMELAGLEAEDVVAVGDSDVDVELLRAAGLGVAVGDATPRLKEAADLVVSSGDGEGFAELASMLLEGRLSRGRCPPSRTPP